jgi:suppressor of G2 allele of SKP1
LKTVFSRIKSHEWFQTETHVTVSVFIKNVKKENVTVEIEPRAVRTSLFLSCQCITLRYGANKSFVQLNVAVKLPGSSEVQVDFDLADEIVPADSKYEVLSTKIEIKLKKSRAARWQTLENTGANPVSTWDAKVEPTSVPAAKLYPSSKGAKDWDKIGSGEEEDKLEGDAALNKVRRRVLF